MNPPKEWDGNERLERKGASDEEILANEVERLRAARPIREFERVIRRMERRLPEEMLMCGNKGKPWREAWVALQFGVATKATDLGITASGAPNDFVLRRAGEDWLEYQATEALLEGRKRDDEIKASVPGQVTEADHREIRRESDGALPSIIRALEKKTRTARGGRLVIYWNTGWLIGARTFIDGLRAQSEPYRDQFAEAWVMGKRSLFRVSPDFEMVQGPPTSLGAERANDVRVLDKLYSDMDDKKWRVVSLGDD